MIAQESPAQARQRRQQEADEQARKETIDATMQRQSTALSALETATEWLKLSAELLEADVKAQAGLVASLRTQVDRLQVDLNRARADIADLKKSRPA